MSDESASRGATTPQHGERTDSQRPQSRLPDAQPADTGLEDVEGAGKLAEREVAISIDDDREQPTNSKTRMPPEENRMRTSTPTSTTSPTARETDARARRPEGVLHPDRPEPARADTALRLTEAGQSGGAGSLKASPQLNRETADQSLRRGHSAEEDRQGDIKPLSRPVEQQRHVTLPAADNSNRQTAESQLRAIARDIVAERLTADLRVTDTAAQDDHRMQTLLALKGLSEIPPTANGWDVPQPEREPTDAKQLKREPELSRMVEEERPDNARDIVAQPGPRFGRDSVPGAFEPALARPEAESEAKAANRTETGATAPAVQGEQDQTMAAKAAPPRADGLGFAYAAQQPVRDGFRAEAPDERQARDDEGQERGDEEAREDPEQRRERLARKATDDLLRPEPDADPALKITRDSSEADRAYALYQRMGGF